MLRLTALILLFIGDYKVMVRTGKAITRPKSVVE